MSKKIINIEKKEHLKMIEDIITRMASNSFQLKSWTVSLISAILIFADFNNEISFIWIAYIPIFVFWALDAFYLQLERKYRGLYNSVQKDLINDTNNVPYFDMNTSNVPVNSIVRIMFSKSIWPVYVVILFATLFVFLKNEYCI